MKQREWEIRWSDTLNAHLPPQHNRALKNEQSDLSVSRALEGLQFKHLPADHLLKQDIKCRDFLRPQEGAIPIQHYRGRTRKPNASRRMMRAWRLGVPSAKQPSPTGTSSSSVSRLNAGSGLVDG